MSFEHQQWAKHIRYNSESHRFTKAEREVLMILSDFANHDGECWPSVDTIGKQGDIAEKTVRRSLQKLEKEGIIIALRHTGKRNHYRIPVPIEFDPTAQTYNDSPAQGMTAEEKSDAALALFLQLIGKTKQEWLLEAFVSSVPGVSDPYECKKIHEELCENPAYGDTPGQRIINAILHGQHPNWGGNSRE